MSGSPPSDAVPNPVDAPCWLAVEAGGHGLLLPVEQVMAVHRWQAPQPLPWGLAPAWLGLVELDGQACLGLDLGAWLGGPPLAGRVTEPVWLSLRAGGSDARCAWALDRVAGLRSAPELPLAAQAAPGPWPPFAGPCHRDAQGRGWQVIWPERMLTDPRYLEIAA